MNLFLFFTLLLYSCGGGPNPDRDALNDISNNQIVAGEKFEFVSPKDNLSFGNGTVSGQGSLRFAQSLESPQTNFNFNLLFELEDGAALTFVTHSNTLLGEGVEFKFQRLGAQLKFFVTSAGVTDDWTQFLSSLDVSQQVSLSLDVHNNEAFAHVVFWNHSTGVKLFDSSVNADGLAGRGQGPHWGMKLEGGKVFSVQKGPPRDDH